MFAILVFCWYLRPEFASAISYWQDVNQPSEKSGKLVAEWNRNMKINPEELGEYIEGDILFPTISRNGLVNSGKRWHDGIVPYEIEGPYTPKELIVIYQAMLEYHKYTCIRFREKGPDDSNYVLIRNTKTGCWSSVGMIGGQQNLNLQSPGCLLMMGTTIHELMHAIGFTHEHNRFIRDDYVDIQWDNLYSGKEKNFLKRNNVDWTSFGFGYDYESVSHYSEHAFSKSNLSTIVPKVAGVQIGQRVGFSVTDVAKIRRMYNCTDT